MSGRSRCLPCTGRKNLEEKFPHHNWPIVIALILSLNYTSFIVFSPSIYQFVTTPRHPPKENEEESGRYWKGLGGDEADYAWVSTSFSIFETALFPLASLMMHTLPFTPSFWGTILLYTLAGVLYGCATQVWMVILARSLMGTAALLGSAIIFTYIGENGTIMDEFREKKGRRPLKQAVYTFATFATIAMQVLLLGINAALVRIQTVDPYRLPGWVLTSLGLLAALIVLLFFSETRPWTCNMHFPKCYSKNEVQLSLKLNSKMKTYFIRILFVLSCGYVNGEIYSVIYTLVSPILSDQFGFTVANTSVFYLLLAVGLFIAFFVLLLVKIVRGNNRILVGFTLIISLIGCTLASDWQAFSGDPCSSLTFNSTNSTNATHAWIEDCEALSTDTHQCFWNPQSRVTGDYCNTCLPVCLSLQISLNFYQFSIGVLLMAVAATLQFIFNLALVSDITQKRHQGAIMTLTIASGALARAVTPLWYLKSYEMTGRHTNLPMSITIVTILFVFISLVVLYKDTAPRAYSETKKATNEIFTMSDTCTPQLPSVTLEESMTVSEPNFKVECKLKAAVEMTDAAPKQETMQETML